MTDPSRCWSGCPAARWRSTSWPGRIGRAIARSRHAAYVLPTASRQPRGWALDKAHRDE
jgi:hypothetical protein